MGNILQFSKNTKAEELFREETRITDTLDMIAWEIDNILENWIQDYTRFRKKQWIIRNLR